MTREIKIAILAILWLTPLVILGLALHSGWHAVWAAVGVPALVPKFADLRGITGGLVTLQRGGDPMIANPADHWNRALNYPRIWLYLFSWLNINAGNVW